MAKRAKRLFAPEARKLLADLIPLLKVVQPENPETDELHDAMATTRLLERAIASEDLELLLTASVSDKAAIVRRIVGFAYAEGNDPKLLIGRCPPGASDRAPLFLAMQRLCHGPEFDYNSSFRKLPEKDQRAALQRMRERLRDPEDDE